MDSSHKRRDSVPAEFQTFEEAAEFWGTHDLTDYEDVWKEVNLQVNLNSSGVSISLEPQIIEQVFSRAKAQHVSPDDFANRVLKEYLEKRAA